MSTTDYQQPDWMTAEKNGVTFHARQVAPSHDVQITFFAGGGHETRSGLNLTLRTFSPATDLPGTQE